MRYPDHVPVEVCASTDMVELVSSYVPLKQKGGSYFGLCPFHNEKTPSFSVSPLKQTFRCFGCGATGNAITFVMKMENMGFLDALRMLSDRSGYRLPELDTSPQGLKASRLRETLLDIHKTAARFFYDTLQKEPEGPAAMYLERRGMSAAICRRFGLGYADGHKDSLYMHLTEAGYDQDAIVQSGLILPSKSGGGFYPRFSKRLMFPIFDVGGKVIAFGGRILDEGEPKYLNSPDTPLFKKSQHLYGLHLARKTGTTSFILVEGYMDVLAMHQAGFKQTVAALGTALNSNHAERLSKSGAKKVILMLDGDTAGIKAALRSIPILVAAGLEVAVLSLTEAKDPDEYIQRFGNEAMAHLISTAQPHIVFQVDDARKRYNLENPEEKVKFTLEVAALLATLDSRSAQEVYAKTIADKVGISPEAVLGDVDRLTALKKVNNQHKAGVAYVGKPLTAEKGVLEAKKNLLGLMATNAALLSRVRPHLTPEEVDDDTYGPLLSLLYAASDANEPPFPASLISQFDTVEAQEKVSQVFYLSLPQAHEEFSLEKVVNDLLRRVKWAYAEKQLALCTEKGDVSAVPGLMDYKRNTEKLYISLSDG